MSRFAVSRAYREFAYCLCDSSPEDYLLVTGLTVAVSIACAIFSRLHGRLNLLLYKPSQVRGELGRYVERIIMMDELLSLGAKGKEAIRDV
ncbi:hypothetical protein E3J38_04210 [candidate division TA06 bacterium]|uniref:Uncharacterized protein n=1 Tax=candidate division TA06 bacterium TaxID=2250710 RepID=A0A523XPS6_UNCT6|nr:MAG: hypothetical protein E3J38_04210 [candidate division TA06 bacterium]